MLRPSSFSSSVALPTYTLVYVHTCEIELHYQEHYVVESLNSLVNACSIAVVDADLSFDNMIIKKINNSPSP